jgi:hypothetical protein
VDTPILESPAFAVHLRVVVHDLPGGLHVEDLEGFHGAMDRVDYHRAHLHHFALELRHPFMKAFAWHKGLHSLMMDDGEGRTDLFSQSSIINHPSSIIHYPNDPRI